MASYVCSTIESKYENLLTIELLALMPSDLLLSFGDMMLTVKEQRTC